MKTKQLLYLSHLLQEPFIVLNLMLDVILCTQFGASAWQISILTTLRPLLAVLAFYWGSILLFKPHLLRFSLVAATALGALLFLFAPFSDSIWYFIAAESLFVLFWRAANPAQMEILKINLDKGERERVYSQALSISYASGIVIGPLLGLFLQGSPHLWKELFCCVAILYSASAWVKSYFYVPPQVQKPMPASSFRELMLKPWKESWRVLKTNQTFWQFQIGFFIAGSGLMFAKPSIPGYLTGMQLSFLEIFSLFTLLEGLGFILTSSLWAKYLERFGLHAASTRVILCFTMQPLFLVLSSFVPTLSFIAYFFYGAAQAGSRLVWNLSGPLLCGNESSSLYSSVNILAIGIRGCFVPLLGAAFATLFGPQASLAVSGLFMLSGAFYLYQTNKKHITRAELS